MKLNVSQQGSAAVITLAGSLLGGPDAAALKNKLHELVAAGKTRVVVNLKDVEFINSSGLAMLIKVTKLSSMFENHSSVDAAIAAFKK